MRTNIAPAGPYGQKRAFLPGGYIGPHKTDGPRSAKVERGAHKPTKRPGPRGDARVRARRTGHHHQRIEVFLARMTLSLTLVLLQRGRGRFSNGTPTLLLWDACASPVGRRRFSTGTRAVLHRDAGASPSGRGRFSIGTRALLHRDAGASPMGRGRFSTGTRALPHWDAGASSVGRRRFSSGPHVVDEYSVDLHRPRQECRRSRNINQLRARVRGLRLPGGL